MAFFSITSAIGAFKYHVNGLKRFTIVALDILIIVKKDFALQISHYETTVTFCTCMYVRLQNEIVLVTQNPPRLTSSQYC